MRFLCSVEMGRVVSKALVYLIDDTTLLNKIIDAQGNTNSRFECAFGEKTLLVEVVLPQGHLLRDEISSIIILSDITTQKDLGSAKRRIFCRCFTRTKNAAYRYAGLNRTCPCEK